MISTHPKTKQTKKCILLPGGVYLPGPGGVGVPAWGVYLPGPGGVPGLGGVPGPGGCVPAWSRGVYLVWGCTWSRGVCTCLVRGGVPAWSWGCVPASSRGVYLPGPRGVYMPGPRGAWDQGVHGPGGCTCLVPGGCTWSQGGTCLVPGGCTWSRGSVPGPGEGYGVPVQVLPSPRGENDTRLWKYYLAPNFVCGR